jgi:hypothetical protein
VSLPDLNVASAREATIQDAAANVRRILTSMAAALESATSTAVGGAASTEPKLTPEAVSDKAAFLLALLGD